MISKHSLHQNQSVFEVIIIGAGPSGLVSSYYLKMQGIEHLVIERADSVGSSWLQTWDNFELSMPVSELFIPGMVLKEAPDYHLKRHEVINLLKNYVGSYKLPIQLDTNILQIIEGPLAYKIRTNKQDIFAKNIIVCVGPRHELKLPSFANNIPNLIKLTEYKNPKTLSDKPSHILVVGSGLSALNIALDIKENTNHEVSLACDYNDATIQENNKHLFFSGFKTLQQKLPSELKKLGIHLISRLENAKDGLLFFSPPELPKPIHAYHAIIFATGYTKHPLSFLPKNNRGTAIQHVYGGIYFVGLPKPGERTITITQGSLEAKDVVERILCQPLTCPPKL